MLPGIGSNIPHWFNRPLTHITPLSLSDGSTYERKLDWVYRYIVDWVVPQLDAKLDEWLEDISSTKDSWQKLFDDFMADVVAQLEALNDQAAANLVLNQTSKLRIALNSVFASKSEFESFKTSISNEMRDFKVQVADDFAALSDDLNALISDFKNQTNAALAKKMDLDSVLVNVKDYGAKGDSNTDDTAAVQRAVDFIKTRGRGRLFFPAGDYYIRSAVYLTSNMEIFGEKATIRKKSASDPTYCVFIGSSGSSRGYGVGASNLYIHDLRFVGKFGADARGLCVMALHHSDNVVAERLVIEQCSGGGHRFDLQGCRYVTVRDSVFMGFDGTLGSLYNEDIQADFSSKRSGSFIESDLTCYDGLTSSHITVENNKWLPLKVGGFTYPAANPFGTHGTIYERYISDLVFRNNYIENPVSDTSGTGVPGTLAFVGVKNVLVENNKLVGGAQAAPAIAFYQGTGGQDPANVGTDLPSISYPFPMRCENVTVRGNEISGFTGAPSVIRVHGSDVSRAFDVDISDNLIYKANDSGGNENSGPLTIHLVHCQRVKLKGNSVRESRRLAHVQSCLDVSVLGNNSNGNALNDLTVQDCTRVAIDGNTFNSVVGYGVYSTGSTAVVVNGNTFASRSGSTQPMIQIGGARQFSVMGNSLTGFSATFGIYIVDSTGVVAGNSAVGFTTPLTPSANSGGVQVSLNAL